MACEEKYTRKIEIFKIKKDRKNYERELRNVKDMQTNRKLIPKTMPVACNEECSKTIQNGP